MTREEKLELIASLKQDGYTVEALADAGVPYPIAKKCLADGPHALPMAPRTALAGRGRAPHGTAYAWGPDAAALLLEPANGFLTEGIEHG